MSHSYLSAGRPNDSFHQHSAFQFATQLHSQRNAQNHSRARSTISWLVSIKDPTVDKLTVLLTLPLVVGTLKTHCCFCIFLLPFGCTNKHQYLFLCLWGTRLPTFLFQFFALFNASCNSLGAKRRYSFFVCVFNFEQWWDDCVFFFLLSPPHAAMLKVSKQARQRMLNGLTEPHVLHLTFKHH